MLQAVVLSLPTIESSYVNHTTKGITGFDHPEYPALAVALEALNAAEGYLWVCYQVNRIIIALTQRFFLAFNPWIWFSLWRLNLY